MGRTLLFAALLLIPRISAAQDADRQPVQELFLTEVVYSQDKGEVQLTLGSLVDRSRSDLAAFVPFSIEYGITNRWQVEAGWAGYAHFQQAPFKYLATARLSVGTKYSLMHIGHSPVHAAIGVDAEFPRPGSFASGEGETGTEVEPFVALAADLPARIGLFASFGASMETRAIGGLVARGERPDDPGTLSGGVLVAFAPATAVIEYTTRTDNLPWRLNGSPLITPSIVVRPAERWEFAVGLPTGMRAGQRRPGLGLSLAREF